MGSIPAFRAVTTKNSFRLTSANAEARCLAQIRNIEKTTDMKFVENLKESYNELVHKVSWPTRKELSKSAVLVLIASIILALIVWLMDFSFESIMTFVYGLF